MTRTPGFVSNSEMSTSVRSLVLLAAALALTSGCNSGSTVAFEDENDPPVIRRILMTPERAHAAEQINVRVEAVDGDPGTDLRYRWEVTRGSFPLGRTIPGVQWNTALERGIDTLTVRVTDLEDTVYASKVVELVLPAEPPSLSTVNFSNLADLRWAESIDDGIQHWKGYLVYAGQEDLRGRSEEELEPFLLDETPTRMTSRRVLGLEIGTRYFFHVRSVREYEGVVERGPLSEPIDMSPRPENLIAQVFEMARFTGGHGVDLSEQSRLLLDPNDPSPLPDVDLYLGTSDFLDGPGTLMLKSVSLLSNRNEAWAGREVLIKSLEEAEWDVSTTTDDEWSTSAPAIRDRVYAVKTPEGNYAKIRVTDVQGGHPNRTVRLQVAYQTLSGYPNF